MLNKKLNLVQMYQDKIDNISAKEFNEDQKMLCKELLSKTDDDKLEAVYQFLAQRLKKGFVFDVAPELNGNISAILVRDANLSFGESDNRLIIGENYDALKNLVELSKQNNRGDNTLYDVIYIDPPYNTEATAEDGNCVANDKEAIANHKFIYRDKFSGQGWLNLMNERLKMAKQLLAEDGFIAISIDDNEYASLKLLCDEVFGVENFITTIVWQKKNTGSASDSKFFKNVVEYILFYAKNKNNFKLNSVDKNVEDGSYQFEDDYVAKRGKYKINKLDRNSLSYSTNLDYEFEHQGQFYYPGGSKEKWLARHRGKHGKKDWCWRWSKEKLAQGVRDGYVIFKDGTIYTKQYQYVDNSGNQIERQEKFVNLIVDGNKQGATGTSELKNIFNGDKLFEHPKPVNLITHILAMHPKKDARVLDFFAGSGTTGHAVLELNRQDGGNRVYTLVTNNQNGIGEHITYERLYRINQGVGTKGEEVEWVKKNVPYNANLSVYQIDYCDNSLNASTADLDNFAKKWNKLLVDFGINVRANAPRAILKSLAALAPQKLEN